MEKLIRPKYDRHPAEKTMRNFVEELTTLCNQYRVDLVCEDPASELELLKFQPTHRIIYGLDEKALEIGDVYILRSWFIEEKGEGEE